jgi:hypothetical protein
MPFTLRCYLFEDAGAIKRIPRRVAEAMIFGKDGLPEYANSVQRVATAIIENENGKPVRVAQANGSFWTFDEAGKIHDALAGSLGEWAEYAFRSPNEREGKVVSLTPSLKRKRFQQEHVWELSKEHLDWIVADVWPSADDDASKVTVAKGTQPKRPPLTYEANRALREIGAKIANIQGELESLSEPALKGLAHAARQNSELEKDIWDGLAVNCDRLREIKSRHRTGRGVWFAVIEAFRTYPGRDIPEVLDEAFEKCQGKKAATVAARRLLKENAHKFNEETSIEARLYCELEWQPSEARRSGLSTSVY